MITIGLLYPGSSAEDDFAVAEKIISKTVGDLRLPLVHTAMDSDAHRPEELRAWGRASVLAEGAAELSPQAPDALLWACTSGSFVFGWKGAQEQADELAARCRRPASSTSLAFAHAVSALDLRTIAVAASYPDDVARLFVHFLGEAGSEVINFGVSDILYASDVGKLGRDEVIGMVRAADVAAADAVLIPDTAMHTLSIIDDLEQAIGKPVLTANQVTVWEGLRLLKQLQPVAGLGRLFAISPA